ncbi:MAG: DUF3078 domain-containing protein [Marinilabiliales bacterium]|nr:DUF3078 domain-containing protein [Marinilabiliales bacterium]
MAQSSFTNWAAGGQNSVALNGLLNLAANYKKDKSAWDNALTIGYGKMVQQGSDLGWVKTDDRIDFQSKYGRAGIREVVLFRTDELQDTDDSRLQLSEH